MHYSAKPFLHQMLFTRLHQKPSHQTIFASPSRVDSTPASHPRVQLMLFVSQGITQEALRHDVWSRVSSVSVHQCIKTKWGMAYPQIADSFLGLMIPVCFWDTLSMFFKSCDRSISGNEPYKFWEGHAGPASDRRQNRRFDATASDGPCPARISRQSLWSMYIRQCVMHNG